MLLGCHHILIARTEYLIDLGNGFGAVGHSTNGLHTTYFINLADSCYAGSHQDGGIYLALAVGRRTEHNLLASGNLGWGSQHQHGGEEGSGTAGNIQSDALYGNTLLPADNAFLRLYLLSDKPLGDMKDLDVVVCQDNGVAQLVADQLLCLVHLLFRDGQRCQGSLVKLQFILADSFVATCLDVCQDRCYGVVQLCQVQTRTGNDVRPHFPFRISIYYHFSNLLILTSNL